ncbi:MAG: cation acetate symporter [Sciscionella sp.]
MELNSWAVAGMVIVGALTFYLGYHGSRTANTTQDFLVARRMVRSRRNAAAITGEYLSAASFLGVAGLVLKDGVDALWYPVGFTAGYLALLLFVAAPLRRSGAYTLPDFVEARLGSRSLRKLAMLFVVLIAFLYLTPQLQGAGLTLSTVLPVPSWVGAVVVTVLVVANVIGGGMRAVTLVQAFQYWVKLFAIAAPTFVLFTVFMVAGQHGQTQLSAPRAPNFTHNTTVTVKTPVTLQVSAPVRLRAQGTVDGFATDGGVLWNVAGTHTVAAGTKLEFRKGSPVPVVAEAKSTNADWLRPGSGGLSGVLADYSLIFALFAGTMGLPHVLVRFYTNPDGRAARRTTLHVLLLLGIFYLFPTILGALSRLYTPELLVTGQTDAAVLLLPSKVLGGEIGQVFTAVIAAGAFAAFLSTCSGLLVSISGVLSTDVLPGRVRDFRFAALIACVVPLVLALGLRPEDISIGVGMSFALAASTFCPVLVLGIWWRGLTWVGAAAGIVTGGFLVVAALVVNIVSGYTGEWAPMILQQPALVTVPVAFVVVIAVSKATRDRAPADINAIMMRLHAPDRLGFFRDRDLPRFGAADERLRLMPGKHRR